VQKTILSKTPALKEIAEQDAVIVSGSGTLNDSYIYGTAFIWCITICIANILKVPTILVGQQIGPLQTAISRGLIGIALRNSRFVGVRDEESLTLALTLGCRTERVQFTGDEGQYILPMTDHASTRPPRPFGNKRYIAVHFRRDKNCPFGKSMKSFSNTIDYIARELDASVLLVPFSYGNSKCDLEDCKEISKLLHTETEVIDSFISSSIHKYLISESIAAIGVANHFCVFAASVNVPTLGIYGSTYMEQKLNGVARAHDHVLTVDINDLERSDQTAVSFINHCSKFMSSRYDLKLPATRKPYNYSHWLSLMDSNHAKQAKRHMDD
jgi:polysaccharide pyruvyl transferase WcaK-like protein